LDVPRGTAKKAAKQESQPTGEGGCAVSAAGPLDLEVLAQLRALAGHRGLSLADDAIDAFQKELPTRLRVLRDALGQSDWRTAEHCAQALRGIANTLGAREVVRVSGELAEALGRGTTAEAAPLLAELERAGTEALAALEQQRSPAP
jgi:HPt (histidine-containing phosphotransfer) domain-containing protein